jgi:hypothetical protein
VVFACGTFEAPGVGATGQAFVDALDARLPGKSVEIDLASLDSRPLITVLPMPPTKSSPSPRNLPEHQACARRLLAGRRGRGLHHRRRHPGRDHPARRPHRPMPPAIADHIAAVVLFGTPSDWFLSLVDHSAPPFTIGDRYTAKILELCAPGDLSAHRAASIAPHTVPTRPMRWTMKLPASSPPRCSRRGASAHTTDDTDECQLHLRVHAHRAGDPAIRCLRGQHSSSAVLPTPASPGTTEARASTVADCFHQFVQYRHSARRLVKIIAAPDYPREVMAFEWLATFGRSWLRLPALAAPGWCRATSD